MEDIQQLQLTNSTNNKYTIICTQFQYGQITEIVDKENVRKECERLKNVFNKDFINTYIQVEVINNETGEIREYWNNKKNEIQF